MQFPSLKGSFSANDVRMGEVSLLLYIHIHLVDRFPKGLHRANETQPRHDAETTFKNPNWPEANQRAIYKCSREVEPGTRRIKFMCSGLWISRQAS